MIGDKTNSYTPEERSIIKEMYQNQKYNDFFEKIQLKLKDRGINKNFSFFRNCLDLLTPIEFKKFVSDAISLKETGKIKPVAGELLKNSILDDYAIGKKFYNGENSQLLHDEDFWEGNLEEFNTKFGMINGNIIFDFKTATGRHSSKSPSFNFKVEILPVSPDNSIKKTKFAKNSYARDNNTVIVSFNSLVNINFYKLKLEQVIKKSLISMSADFDSLKKSDREAFKYSFEGIILNHTPTVTQENVDARFNMHNFSYLKDKIDNYDDTFLKIIQSHYIKKDTSNDNHYMKSFHSLENTDRFQDDILKDIGDFIKSDGRIISKFDIIKKWGFSDETLEALIKSYDTYDNYLDNIVKSIANERISELSKKSHMKIQQFKIRKILDEILKIERQNTYILEKANTTVTAKEGEILNKNLSKIEKKYEEIKITLDYTADIVGADRNNSFVDGLEPYQLKELLNSTYITDEHRILIEDKLMFHINREYSRNKSL